MIWLVYRESVEYEKAYVDAETPEEAKEIAENDPEVEWKWVMSDSVEVTVVSGGKA